MKRFVLSALAALLATSAAAQTITYPTSTGAPKAGGSVAMLCNNGVTACTPVTAANPLPVTGTVSSSGGTVTIDQTTPGTTNGVVLKDSAGTVKATVAAGSLNALGVGSNVNALNVNAILTTYDTLNSQWALVQNVTNGTNSTGVGTIGVGLMAQRDDTSPVSITENQFGNVRIGSSHQILNAELGHYPYSAILGTPATPIRGASGNVAAANAVATLTGTATTTVYITGFTCTPGGATAAALVDIAITGTLGGTLTYTAGAPAGATLMGTPISATFYPAYPASAVNTPIVVTMPSLGTGNAHAACVATGYYM